MVASRAEVFCRQNLDSLAGGSGATGLVMVIAGLKPVRSLLGSLRSRLRVLVRARRESLHACVLCSCIGSMYSPGSTHRDKVLKVAVLVVQHWAYAQA